jgi:hypothetical protein
LVGALGTGEEADHSGPAISIFDRDKKPNVKPKFPKRSIEVLIKIGFRAILIQTQTSFSSNFGVN